MSFWWWRAGRRLHATLQLELQGSSAARCDTHARRKVRLMNVPSFITCGQKEARGLRAGQSSAPRAG